MSTSSGTFLLAFQFCGLLLLQPFDGTFILTIVVQELGRVQCNLHASLFRGRFRLLTAVCLDQTRPFVTALKDLLESESNLRVTGFATDG